MEEQIIKLNKKYSERKNNNVIIEENEQDTFLKIKTVSNLNSNDLVKLDKSQNLSQALNVTVKLFKA